MVRRPSSRAILRRARWTRFKTAVRRAIRRTVITLLVMGALVMAVYGWWQREKARIEREASCRITYVYDGDTVELTCAGEEETARVVGLDTPETKEPGCAEEAAHGKRATLRLRELVAQGPVELTLGAFDKYGRRLLTIYVDGDDVADTLVDEGLAVAYRGGQRPNWCRRLR